MLSQNGVTCGHVREKVAPVLPECCPNAAPQHRDFSAEPTSPGEVEDYFLVHYVRFPLRPLVRSFSFRRTQLQVFIFRKS